MGVRALDGPAVPDRVGLAGQEPLDEARRDAEFAQEDRHRRGVVLAEAGARLDEALDDRRVVALPGLVGQVGVVGELARVAKGRLDRVGEVVRVVAGRGGLDLRQERARRRTEGAFGQRALP